MKRYFDHNWLTGREAHPRQPAWTGSCPWEPSSRWSTRSPSGCPASWSPGFEAPTRCFGDRSRSEPVHKTMFYLKICQVGRRTSNLQVLSLSIVAPKTTRLTRPFKTSVLKRCPCRGANQGSFCFSLYCSAQDHSTCTHLQHECYIFIWTEI